MPLEGHRSRASRVAKQKFQVYSIKDAITDLYEVYVDWQ